MGSLPCEQCPFRNRPGGVKVVESPECKTKSGVAVIGEGPAREEYAYKRCFSGPSGNELDLTLGRARLHRSEVAVENAFACVKPDDARPHEEVRAVEACKGRVWRWVEEVKPKALLLLGGRAVRSVMPGFVLSASNDGLMRHRGSLWSRKEVDAANFSTGWSHSLPMSVEWVMATIHPAAIIRRKRIEKFPAMGYRLVPALDTYRLVDAVKNGRRLLGIPAAHDGLLPMRDVEKAGGFVFDLETTWGDRVPELLGVQALGGGDVYQSKWGWEAKEWCKEAFKLNVKKVGHNIGGFDLPVLLNNGVEEVREPVVDTMTLGGLCEPDMARGLYFQQAYYFGERRPYHKELAGARQGEEEKCQRALRASWEAEGLAPKMWVEDEWMRFYNRVDVDSTRILMEMQMNVAKGMGWV